MKKTINLIVIALVAFVFSNCASSIYPAFIFNSSEYHVSGGPTAGPTDAKILKSGKSCNNYSLFNYLFYSGGEGSITEAMKNGQITKVAVVDKSTFGILGPIFSQECVVVFGE
ncbi:TRL domain-containing protein [Leptospira ellisii]|uniref:TRL domain-containing protein n=1 Tax=Leptospira ellisii TaxID=2023197 RepID=A0A2N0BP91_9LEPT|nr:TRL domain-containing protein [Leptospira ellisii]MDV6236506.1 TRL domain-containing protein [Leptospira ellisii]PJZ94545.1 TRL-like family protein [Leptospira ellisii]PKA05809.1 TRL-like family protein [Leptospira ellisii]